MTRHHSRGAQGGQVAVLFALAAIAIVAIVGLAIDAGTSYVDQRTLQAGSDTAATAGASLLAADFKACESFGQTPYSDSDISQVMSGIATKAVTASGQATRPVSIQYVTWNPGATPAIQVTTTASGTWCPSQGTWTGPTGVTVGAFNQHRPAILQVVGIQNASETASATAAFQLEPGGEYGPFIICATNPLTTVPGQTKPNQVQLGDTVIVSDPHWAKKETDCISGSSDYHGFLHHPSPSTITFTSAGKSPSPGTITSKGGCTVGQFPPLTVGDVLTLPLVNMVKGSGTYTISVNSLVAVRIDTIASCYVTGTVVPLGSYSGGPVPLCSPASPGCLLDPGVGPLTPTVVRLVN